MNKSHLPAVLATSFLLFVLAANTFVIYMTYKHPEWMIFNAYPPII
jgi:hypothetical protein